MTAGNVLLVMIGKFALSGALFIVLLSLGLWLGRVGFGGDVKEGNRDV